MSAIKVTDALEAFSVSVTRDERDRILALLESEEMLEDVAENALASRRIARDVLSAVAKKVREQ